MSFQLDANDLSCDEVKWLWDVPEFVPFLQWFIKYTDDSNSLDKAQFQEYKQLCLDGNELRGQELDEALKEYGIDVNKYVSSNLSQLDLELIEKEIDELRIQNDVALEIETLLSEEIQKSCSKEHAAEVRLKAAQALCQKEGQNLMKINVPLRATQNSLFSNFDKFISSCKESTDPDVYNCWLSNMPLENIINKCEKFNEYANLYLKRNFENSPNSEKAVNELMSFLDNESSMRSLESLSDDMTSGLPNKMWKVDISKISMQGTLVGYSTAIKTLSKLKETGALEKYNIRQIKVDLAGLKYEIMRLTDDIEMILKHEVADMSEQNTLQNIYCVVENITRARIERRQLMLRKLCLAANMTNKVLHLTDLMWMLLSNESRIFQFGTELIQETAELVQEELNKHKSTMNVLNNMVNLHSTNSEALRPGQALLVNNVQKLCDLSIDNSDSGNGTLSESRFKELEHPQFSSIMELFKKTNREHIVYELLSQLSNGPTKKPSLVSKDLSLAMEEVQCKLSNYDKQIQNLQTTFSSKQMAFKKYPALKNRRLLWAWFLVAPNELEEAVRLVEESSKRKK